MRYVARLLTFGSAIMGLFVLPRVRLARAAQMLPSWLMVAGLMGAVLALARLDCASALVGLVGVFAARHAMRQMRARRESRETEVNLG